MKTYDPPARIESLAAETCPLTYFTRAECEHCRPRLSPVGRLQFVADLMSMPVVDAEGRTVGHEAVISRETALRLLGAKKERRKR